MVGVDNSHWLLLMKEHQTEIQGPLDLFRGLWTHSKTSYCHKRDSDWSPNVPRGEERDDESSRQVDYLSVARWPDQ